MNQSHEIAWDDPAMLSDTTKFAMSLANSGTAGCRLSAFMSGHSLLAISAHQVSQTHVGRLRQGKGTLWVKTTADQARGVWVDGVAFTDPAIMREGFDTTIPDAFALATFVILVESIYTRSFAGTPDQGPELVPFAVFDRIDSWAEESGRGKPAFLDPLVAM